LREQGLERQIESMTISNKRLTEEMAQFAAYREKMEASISERQTNLTLKERSLANKEVVLDRTNQRLKDWERQLEDERATLGRAWDELKRK